MATVDSLDPLTAIVDGVPGTPFEYNLDVRLRVGDELELGRPAAGGAWRAFEVRTGILPTGFLLHSRSDPDGNAGFGAHTNNEIYLFSLRTLTYTARLTNDINYHNVWAVLSPDRRRIFLMRVKKSDYAAANFDSHYEQFRGWMMNADGRNLREIFGRGVDLPALGTATAITYNSSSSSTPNNITNVSPVFVNGDIGKVVTGPGIPTGAALLALSNGGATGTLSFAATLTQTGAAGSKQAKTIYHGTPNWFDDMTICMFRGPLRAGAVNTAAIWVDPFDGTVLGTIWDQDGVAITDTSACPRGHYSAQSYVLDANGDGAVDAAFALLRTHAASVAIQCIEDITTTTSHQACRAPRSQPTPDSPQGVWIWNDNATRSPSVATVSGTPTITFAAGQITDADRGKGIVRSGIPAGAYILAMVDSTHATLSANATTTATSAATLWNGSYDTDPTMSPAGDWELNLVRFDDTDAPAGSWGHSSCRTNQGVNAATAFADRKVWIGPATNKAGVPLHPDIVMPDGYIISRGNWSHDGNTIYGHGLNPATYALGTHAIWHVYAYDVNRRTGVASNYRILVDDAHSSNIVVFPT